MASPSTALASVDTRAFFARALRHGVEAGLLTPARLQSIREDFAKGIVQIANFFGTAHLRPNLDLSLRRMVNLISLYLEEMSGGNLQVAACSLRDRSFLSHSKAGSDMLKRLHALPDSTAIFGRSVSHEEQRDYLDDRTSAATISLADYQADLRLRLENQAMIDLSFWLARKMGVSREDAGSAASADELIRSAMLALFADRGEPRMPTRTAIVHLIGTARNPRTVLAEARLAAFLKDAPEDFRNLTRRAMQDFIERDLPRLRQAGMTADRLLNGFPGQEFFIRQSMDEDVRDYDRLVAREWHRVTAGGADDPAVLATVFLFIATGMPPKASMLLREAKEVIRVFRTAGFDSAAVQDYITRQAPGADQESLLETWQEDLKPETEGRLADTDPNWPDTHMERALEYLRRTCNATWKGRRK